MEKTKTVILYPVSGIQYHGLFHKTCRYPKKEQFFTA